MRRPLFLAGLLALAGCSLPVTLDQLSEESPPPELGRPAWVRGSAEVGSWIGGAVGGVLSLVALPVTWPVSLLAEEPLGSSRSEFIWAPVGAGAGLGHTAVGMPLDSLDYLFYRAWTHEEPLADEADFDLQASPQGPMQASAASGEWRERAARVREAQRGELPASAVGDDQVRDAGSGDGEDSR